MPVYLLLNKGECGLFFKHLLKIFDMFFLLSKRCSIQIGIWIQTRIDKPWTCDPDPTKWCGSMPIRDLQYRYAYRYMNKVGCSCKLNTSGKRIENKLIRTYTGKSLWNSKIAIFAIIAIFQTWQCTPLPFGLCIANVAAGLILGTLHREVRCHWANIRFSKLR